jgi:hypothetical protein
MGLSGKEAGNFSIQALHYSYVGARGFAAVPEIYYRYRASVYWQSPSEAHWDRVSAPSLIGDANGLDF